ncbi:oxidoreductase, partial [Methylobacterium radiotolerans]
MALSQIALVGLGAMGLPMATNLVAAGFAVRG